VEGAEGVEVKTTGGAGVVVVCEPRLEAGLVEEVVAWQRLDGLADVDALEADAALPARGVAVIALSLGSDDLVDALQQRTAHGRERVEELGCLGGVWGRRAGLEGEGEGERESEGRGGGVVDSSVPAAPRAVGADDEED
jgi:hypothetical protein